MVELKNINNNIISNRWEARYEKLSNEIKEKLKKFDDSDDAIYQLKVIKRKRLYPQKGDLFELQPTENLTLYGAVINNHIDNINGNDLLLIIIFNVDVQVEDVMERGVEQSDLLISPVMVGKEYWTRGYFFNIDNVGDVKNADKIGFYNIGKGKFMDEYGNELFEEPELLGAYGVATISGIAKEINQELIIAEVI